MGHYPAGTSCQAMLHYLQEINTGKFQQYDEGTKAGNMRRYGTPKPPEYDLSKVTVPIFLHYGLNDYLAAVEVRSVFTCDGNMNFAKMLFFRMLNCCTRS